MIRRRFAGLLPIPLALLICLFPGCASRTNSLLRTEIQDLQNRIYELQKRNAEAQVEIQELRERLGPVAESGAPEASGVEAAPSGEPAVPGSTIDLGDVGPTRHAGPPEQAPTETSSPGAPAAGPGPPSQVPGASTAAGEGADQLYVQGYSEFNSGNYQAAQQSFQEFLARSSESDLADDAQYWVGECFFAVKDYRRAILEFRKVIDQYPFGNRVPHAFLKLGLSYLALGDRDRAAENLETVVEAFPKSDVATVARATLDEIRKP